MQELLRHSSVKDVSSIIRVGGFAESPMLQAAITNAFKDKKKKDFIVPRDAGLAVLKGAVLFGHQPKTISARVCKYTYGIGTTIKLTIAFFIQNLNKLKKMMKNFVPTYLVFMFAWEIQLMLGNRKEIKRTQ